MNFNKSINEQNSIECLQRKLIAGFCSNFSIEVTPKSLQKYSDLSPIIRKGTIVYITCIPGTDFEETIQAAERLRNDGYEPVPHIAVRGFLDASCVELALARLKDRANVKQIMLIAGGLSKPEGNLKDTMQYLETGQIDRWGIKHVGIAGHPEGSPDIKPEDIRHALQWKNEFARRSDASFHIVTQFCFEAEPIIAWDKTIQGEGNRLPIHIGIPGPASIRTLLNYAKTCGIGASSRFLVKQASSVSKLLTRSAPDRLVRDLANYRANDPKCGISQMHMFPLGGIEASASWAYAVAEGRFDVNAAGGFSINAS